MSRLRRAIAAGLTAALTAVACVPDAPLDVPSTDPPPEPGTPLLPAHLDCARWRYDGIGVGELPAEWGRSTYMESSKRDRGLARSPQHLCGQLGAAVDLAWSLERGRPDVVVAVLDSGIDWRDPEVVVDLGDNAYLNRGELPVPRPAGSRDDPWDANGDGRFSVSDYADDPRVTDRNGNGVLDPEDVILTPEFNDGIDGDANGYVDDISGWDFLHDDNNPNDDVGYGHGTGEARDAVAAHDGEHDFGECVECMHLPVRVSDSFMADGGRFAAGVLFALDSGAAVVLDALGAVSNPPQAQAALDLAWDNGLPVIASMADEQSQHANLPAALNHTIPVNSVTEAFGFLGDVGTFVAGVRDTLAVNGCTNVGGLTWVSVPSDGCSSEAAGNAAGIAALIISAARNAGVDLSVAELAQVIRAGADDIDFSTPNAIDPANNLVDPFGQRRFPSVKGWDAVHGYGRINAYESVKAVLEGNIPPESDIVEPRWFELQPTTGTLPVVGRVDAPRAGSYDYRVEWTTGLQPPLHPGADTWHVVTERTGLTAPVDGVLATIDLATVAAMLAGGGRGVPLDEDGLPDPDRFTVRVRVVVTDDVGRVATTHRHFAVHEDPSLVRYERIDGVGMSSPVFADLDEDGSDELVLASDDGVVRVLRADGSSLEGFPVRTPPASYWHAGSAWVRAAGIDTPHAAIGAGAPAIADLDGDGTLDIVVSDAEGGVHAWSALGERSFSARVEERFSRGENTDRYNRTKRGIFAAPSLGDLDGDGDLEVVVAAMDRHVYAWHHDGTPVAGFPVLVVDPSKVTEVDPETHRVVFADESTTGIGGELIATPAIADLDGDGRDDIVVGAQEQYDEAVAAVPPIGVPGGSGNTRLYAISGLGTNGAGPERNAVHPHEQAYLPGWPVALPMVMTDVLPTIGGGVSMPAAIGDVDGDGRFEVVASSVAGPIRVLRYDGTSLYWPGTGLPTSVAWLGAAGPGTNSHDAGMIAVSFGGPSIGRFGRPDRIDVVAPTSGLGRALDTVLPNDQQGQTHLSAWSGPDGALLPAFPRVTSDLSFFVAPALADVDGDGVPNAVAANGVHLIDAFAPDGSQATGWPKLTGGWVVGTTGFGDHDGDGVAEAAVARRDGVLMVWRIPTPMSGLGDWIRSGANGRNDQRVTTPET